MIFVFVRARHHVISLRHNRVGHYRRHNLLGHYRWSNRHSSEDA